MMKKYIIFLTALALLLSACVKEESNTEIGGSEYFSVELTTMTKTILSNDGMHTNWCPGDAVGIQAEYEDELVYFGSLKSDDEGFFSGNLETAGLDNDLEITINYPDRTLSSADIPHTQNATPGSFDNGAALMYAEATLGELRSRNSIELKHLSALLKFTIASYSDVYGNVCFNLGDSEKQYTVTGCESGETYYVCVWPGVCSLSYTIDGYPGIKSKDRVTFEAGKIYDLGELQANIPGPTIKSYRDLEFPQQEYTTTYGMTFTAPTLSGETNGVTYSSSNTDVAVVDSSNGAITLIGGGEAVITAYANENETHYADDANYTLIVEKANRDLSFNPTSVSVVLGETVTAPELTGVIDGEVDYSSSNTDVATVSGGTITTKTSGQTTITATVKESKTHNEGSASYTLYVTPNTVRLYVESEKTGFTMNIYAWGVDGVELPNTWPGVPLSWDSTVSKYYYDFPIAVKGNELSFIINVNGNECQSADQKITFDDMQETFALNWKWLYLKPNSNWKQDSAKFAAYFFTKNVNGEYWQWMMKLDTNHYGCVIPGDYKNVIFCRMNSSATNMNWNNKWNQTGDLTVPTDGKNLFTITQWDNQTLGWSKMTN